MTKQEFEYLKNYNTESRLIDHEFLRVKKDRTLIYGCTYRPGDIGGKKITFHLYIKDLKIKAVTYGYKEDPQEMVIRRNEDMIPQKRLYAERCDLEFCKVLKRLGYHMSFTAYDDREFPQEKYYGKVLPEDEEVLTA